MNITKTKAIISDESEESDEETTDKESDEETSEKESDDTVCCICDNGGRVLCCDGECQRCFHATVADAGAEYNCKTLGLSKAELAAPKFFCLNCQHKQHQCFACGKLGSSECNSTQEVFSCDSCGHFYHSKCVGDLLYPGNEVGSKHLQNKIVTGESFTCPAHKCHECKKDENSMVRELQFAICRRCPRAYHRKCLPRDIAYAGKRGLVKRSWANLLPRHRILIYCLRHEIEKGQATPKKDHIVFPEVKAKDRSSPSSQQRVFKRKRIISEEFQRSISAKKTKQVETTLKDSMKSPIDQSLVPCSMTLNDFKRQYKNRVKLGKSKVVNTANSQEKAEATEQHVRTALQKLDEHSKLHELKDGVDPEMINQIAKWKVVDKLHVYVHKGDTVVNVSFSANDFTCSMKQRIEGSGKDCSFKDYDVCQSKNVCTVEDSDWLSVGRLATGSKLIIFLNIPVGISSALANDSINKALDFKPKLLVLFVPEDTKRLEKKPYELIWKDRERLSSKLLPSSMRISDNKMKLWNSNPPVLYLWSRTDWCPEHKEIARLCGHMSMSQNDSNVEAEEGGLKEEEENKDEEGKEEEENKEQEQGNHRMKEITSAPPNEDHMPRNSLAPGENLEEEDKKDEDEGHDAEEKHEHSPDNSRPITSPGHGMPPSSSAPTENQKAFVFDFAPGPYRPYSHDEHSCCGWIDDDEE